MSSEDVLGTPFLSRINIAELARASTSFQLDNNTESVSEKPIRRVRFNDTNQIHVFQDDEASEDDSVSTKQQQQPLERISKKDVYDGLLKKIQDRHKLQQQQTTATISEKKPNYWYPVSSSTLYSQSLPIIRSLEHTEQLINESIQREYAALHALHAPEVQSLSSEESTSDSINEEKDSIGDFSGSVYNELAKLNNEQIVPSTPKSTCNDNTSEYQALKVTFPFERDHVSKHAPSIDPLTLDGPPVWTDIYPTESFSQQNNTQSILFIKLLRIEALDVPIESNTKLYATICYQSIESKSQYYPLDHSISMSHEMRLTQVDPDEQIAITFHIEPVKKPMGWYHRILPPQKSDLQRYIHPIDRSVCQTLFTPRRFENSPFTCQASLLLVNNWYRPLKPTLQNEKAMGKLYIECLYLPKVSGQVPMELNRAVQDLNSMRFHQTIWQSGYMSQLGGNTRYIKRRFFTLKGGCLYAAEKENKEPEFRIELSRVLNVLSDDVLKKQSDPIMRFTFRLIFDNHDDIQFSCDCLEEYKKWLSLIQVMITNVPAIPHWKIV